MKKCLCILVLAAALLTFPSESHAQTFNIDIGQVEDFDHDYFRATSITYASGPNVGQSALGGEGDLLCFNRARSNPIIGNTHLFEERQTSYFFLAGGSEKGEAMINWMIDNYYDAMVTTQDYTDRYPLHLALWEVAHDFDGTVGSLDIYSGENNLSGGPGSRPDIDYLVYDLIANYDSISTSYRSSLYNITYLEDLTEGGEVYQSMLLVTPVPEPSSAILLVSALGFFTLLNRRRKA